MTENISNEKRSKKYLAELSIATIGVVFGDLGTSPLYVFQDSFSKAQGLNTAQDNVLGILSLIFWSLMLVICIKYLSFVLRADSDGEGGTMALIALISPHRGNGDKLRRWLVIAGLLGGAFLVSDFFVTPAITVVSAIGGLSVASLHLSQSLVVWITIAILLALFSVQRFGSGGLGKIFGPILTIWFITIAILGVIHIVQNTAVLRALNPYYAINFFGINGMSGYLILGSVFLAVTGAEAVYADIGHFGVLPIRLTWYGIILPALLLNYFGQGALLLQHPEAAVNPFFHMISGWAIYPVVLIATMAAIIASQAVISGAFSFARQAIQLGFVPRMKIEQTSTKEVGQVYLPAINWTMMVICILLVFGFRSPDRLASVYGVSLSTAMVITTLLFTAVTQLRWKWSWTKTLPLVCIFVIVDLAFFGANIVKIPTGGWFPVLAAVIIVTMMTTWKRGREILGKRLKSSALPLEKFINDISYYADIEEDDIKRVRGTAVYMYSNPESTPSALLHNVKHNKVLHQNIFLLNVETNYEKPYISTSERIESEELTNGFHRIKIKNGFSQNTNVPIILQNADTLGSEIDLHDLTYFLGKENILPTEEEHSEMAKWRDSLFDLMVRNEQPATKYFNLPPNRVVEIGAQIEL